MKISMVAIFVVVGMILISGINAAWSNRHIPIRDAPTVRKAEISRLVKTLRYYDSLNEMAHVAVKTGDVPADAPANTPADDPADDPADAPAGDPADAPDSVELEKRDCKGHKETCNESSDCCGKSSICSFDGRSKTCYLAGNSPIESQFEKVYGYYGRG